MADYQLTGSPTTVIRRADGAAIPIGAGTGASREYDAWLGLGNTPDVADPLPATFFRVLPVAVPVVRTTDATATEVFRAPLASLTGYAAMLTLVGVDAGNGACRVIRASVAAKRLGGSALLVGAPVVLASHGDAAASSWAISASVSGNDFMVIVAGAAGRTIDWSLSGEIRTFTPAGS